MSCFSQFIVFFPLEVLFTHNAITFHNDSFVFTTIFLLLQRETPFLQPGAQKLQRQPRFLQRNPPFLQRGQQKTWIDVNASIHVLFILSSQCKCELHLAKIQPFLEHLYHSKQ
jgi:hypothetical protein